MVILPEGGEDPAGAATLYKIADNTSANYLDRISVVDPASGGVRRTLRLAIERKLSSVSASDVLSAYIISKFQYFALTERYAAYECIRHTHFILRH